MTEQITRIDNNLELQAQILPLCRLKYGEVWQDLRVRNEKKGL